MRLRYFKRNNVFPARQAGGSTARGARLEVGRGGAGERERAIPVYGGGVRRRHQGHDCGGRGGTSQDGSRRTTADQRGGNEVHVHAGRLRPSQVRVPANQAAPTRRGQHQNLL